MSKFFLRLGLSGFIGLGLVLSSAAVSEADTEISPSETIPSEVSAQNSDELTIRQLTEQWFTAWSPGQRTVDWDAMGQLFIQTPGELLVFDDAGGSVVVLTSWADYLATWEPFMAQFTEWQIEPEGEMQIIVDGDLATTMFTLLGGGVDQSGNTVDFRQRGTHVWQKIDNRWVIVHEHLTTDS